MQKVREYLLYRKKAITVQEIMDRFLISQSTAYKAINSLLSEGRLRRVRRNNKTYFQPNPEGNRPGSGQSARGKSLLFVRLVEEFRSGKEGN